MEKMEFSWTDRVRDEEVLHRAVKEGNILQTVKSREANWIGHIWCTNCLLKQVIEGKVGEMIEVTGRRGRMCKLLLDNLNEKRG